MLLARFSLNMTMSQNTKHAFSVRPAYHSEELLIEFWGETHSPDYPKLGIILATALKACPRDDLSKSSFDTSAYAWEYANGSYLIDKDNWAIFILAPQNNAQIMADIEQVLLSSGLFFKNEVDFKDYR